jgi:ribosomal protein S8
MNYVNSNKFITGKNAYTVFDAIAAINKAIKENRPFIFTKYRSSIIGFLACMRDNNYIYNYEIITFGMASKYIKVYFKYYHSLAPFRYIEILSRPGRYLSITALQLKRLVYRTNLTYIINTSHGYIHHSEALALKSGGFLMCKII